MASESVVSSTEAPVTAKTPDSNGMKEDIDSNFAALCDELNISSDVRSKATAQLKSLLADSKPDDYKHAVTDLFTCALFVALVDTRMPYGPLDPQLQCGYLTAPCISLTTLLQHTNLNIATFFQQMNWLKDHFPLSDSVQHHLLSLEKNYCIISALFHTFERICSSVFREDPKMNEDSNEENVFYFRENVPTLPPVPETEGVSFRKKLCWIVFLHAKHHFLVDAHDLNHAVILLLCCLEFVLRTTPSFLLNSPYDIIRIGCQQTTETRTTNMLGRLSEQVKTSIEEVQGIQQNATEPFLERLHHQDSELDMDKLVDEYEERHRKEGDINELLFLKHDLHLVPSDYYKNRSNMEMNGKISATVPQMMTPIRSAMNTVQQLKLIINSSNGHPSFKLTKYFKSCSVDPSSTISERIDELRKVFTQKFLEYSTSSDTTVADQRFNFALSLYYMVMENMLNMEHDRLSTNDFSKLLCSDCFHKSLLAASVEIVLMTYGLSCCPASCDVTLDKSQFTFPWVLDVFNLEAFDFFKVLESYIKAEPKLTKDITKHLQWVENMILESIAWKEGSSLYSAIQCSDIEPESPSAEETPNSKTAAEMFLSPMMAKCGIIPPTPPSNSSSTSPKVHSPQESATKDVKTTPRRSQSLNLFFSKVGRIGFHKLQKLCSLLGVSREVQHKIWTCLEFCITNKPGLLRNRHIDQIMMCSLYGICKVAEKEVKFKTIVQMYRSLQYVDQLTYKSVFIHGREYDSIIGFYNKVFMHNMKTYILQFSSNKTLTPTLSPVPKMVNSPLTPAFSVPGRKGMFVSPLKQSPFKAPQSPSQLTPRSSLLYSFGEGLGSSQKLKNITESVSLFGRQIPKSTPKGLKRLHFDLVSASDDDQKLPEKMPKVGKKTTADVSPHKLNP